jgi:hypothetical protein
MSGGGARVGRHRGVGRAASGHDDVIGQRDGENGEDDGVG